MIRVALRDLAEPWPVLKPDGEVRSCGMKRSALTILALVVGCAVTSSQDWTLGYRDGGTVKVWATPQGYEAKTGPSCVADHGSAVRVLVRDVEVAEVEVIDRSGQGCRGCVSQAILTDHRLHLGLTGIDSWMPQQVLGGPDGAARQPIFVSQKAAEQVYAQRLIRSPTWRVRPEEQANPCLDGLWHGGGAPPLCRGVERGVGDRNEPRDLAARGSA